MVTLADFQQLEARVKALEAKVAARERLLARYDQALRVLTGGSRPPAPPRPKAPADAQPGHTPLPLCTPDDQPEFLDPGVLHHSSRR